MRYLVVLIFKIVTRLKVLKELLTYFTLCTWSFQLGLCQNAFFYTRIFPRDASQSQEHYSSIASFLFDINAEKSREDLPEKILSFGQCSTWHWVGWPVQIEFDTFCQNCLQVLCNAQKKGCFFWIPSLSF